MKHTITQHSKIYRLFKNIYGCMLLGFMVLLNPVSLQAQENDSGNYIINEFDDYLDNMKSFCDFNKDLSVNLLSQLSSNAKAACSELRGEIAKSARKVKTFDTRQSCETQKDMPWAVCVDNLKLCKRVLLTMKPQIEDCRYKITLDTKTISKYKKTSN